MTHTVQLSSSPQATWSWLADVLVRRPWVTTACLLLPASVVYLGLLTHGTFSLSPFTWYGLTFNSMGLNLLHGRFDVDPATIQDEGFLVGGKTYAYFGILLAVFRLLFLPFVDLKTTNLTIISCLVATLIIVAAQTSITLEIFRKFSKARDRYLLVPFVAIALFAGPQLAFLRPSIYQEVVLWALAFTYVFVGILTRAIFLRGRLDGAVLTKLAVVAGLTLLTRGPTGVGLYAVSVVLLVFIWLSANGKIPKTVSVPAQSTLRAIGPALALLVAFGLLAAFVNYMRFGNPTKFIDPRFHIMSMHQFPERIARIVEHGEINVERAWFGVLYYFFPVWLLHDQSGSLLFPEFRHRLVDMVELPASSFFVSDPLLLIFAGFALFHAIRNWRTNATLSALILSVSAAIAIPAVLSLGAWAYAFRYRAEFYPLFLFLALGGLCVFLQRSAESSRKARFEGTAFYAASAVSVLASGILLGLYYLSPFGDAEKFLARGWLNGYLERVHQVPMETARDPGKAGNPGAAVSR